MTKFSFFRIAETDWLTDIHQLIFIRLAYINSAELIIDDHPSALLFDLFDGDADMVMFRFIAGGQFCFQRDDFSRLWFWFYITRYEKCFRFRVYRFAELSLAAYSFPAAGKIFSLCQVQ